MSSRRLNQFGLWHPERRLKAVRCALCLCDILKGSQPYILKVDLFASPVSPQIEPDELESGGNRRALFERLLDQLENMDAEEVQDEQDRVRECYTFVLCPICRARFHGLLRSLQPLRATLPPALPTSSSDSTS